MIAVEAPRSYLGRIGLVHRPRALQAFILELASGVVDVAQVDNMALAIARVGRLELLLDLIAHVLGPLHAARPVRHQDQPRLRRDTDGIFLYREHGFPPSSRNGPRDRERKSPSDQIALLHLAH